MKFQVLFYFFELGQSEICWKCKPPTVWLDRTRKNNSVVEGERFAHLNYWIPITNDTHFPHSSSRKNESYVG